MEYPTRLSPILLLLLLAQPAAAQRNLGELLDAGASALSADDFRDEVVQHVIIGPTSTGGDLELMYLRNGAIQGVGTTAETMGYALNLSLPISGEWKIDDRGKICTSMLVGRTFLPFRCQIWFKHGSDYFISDSESDRSARVLKRSLKR